MLPPLYAGWMDTLLGGPIPEEAQATCDNCAMLPQEGRPSAGSGYFNPGVKCCSYMPLIPNFSVGRILSDDDPAAAHGQDSTRRRMEARDGITPLGLDQSRRYNLLYDHSVGFGQSPDLLCPHYMSETGGCGIWRNRNSVCSTWFCKFNRGVLGERFWKALEKLLVMIEVDLVWWATAELNPGTRAMRTLLELRERSIARSKLEVAELEGRVDPTLYRQVWGDWYDREEEFYRKCGELVETLAWEDVLAISKPMARAQAQVLQEEYAALMSEEVPDPLVMGPFSILETNGERTLVRSYRTTDPLSLSGTLFRILPYFNGRPNEEVVGEIVKKERVFVRPEVLRRLSDYQVLVPRPEGEEA